MRIRKQICIWLFEHSKTPYATYFKSNLPWNISTTDLLNYPNYTLGHELGIFLTDNNYKMVPKLERHDAYHVITGYGTSVEEEISLQYFFLGNGKISPYLIAVILIGSALLPEYAYKYYTSYLTGKNANKIYCWNIKSLLQQPINAIKQAAFTHLNQTT